VSHEQRAARLVEVAFGQLQRFVDPEPGLPEDHDQRPHPVTMRPAARNAYDSHDFFDLGWVGRIVVPGHLAGVGSGHRGRRPASPGGDRAASRAYANRSVGRRSSS
jgi:hypothetical protein